MYNAKKRFCKSILMRSQRWSKMSRYIRLKHCILKILAFPFVNGFIKLTVSRSEITFVVAVIMANWGNCTVAKTRKAWINADVLSDSTISKCTAFEARQLIKLT